MEIPKRRSSINQFGIGRHQWIRFHPKFSNLDWHHHELNWQEWREFLSLSLSLWSIILQQLLRFVVWSQLSRHLVPRHPPHPPQTLKTHPPLATLELLDSYLSRLPSCIMCQPAHWYSRKIAVSRRFAKKFEVNKKSRMAFEPPPRRWTFLATSTRIFLTLPGACERILGICCYFLFFFFFRRGSTLVDDEVRWSRSSRCTCEINKLRENVLSTFISFNVSVEFYPWIFEKLNDSYLLLSMWNVSPNRRDRERFFVRSLNQ